MATSALEQEIGHGNIGLVPWSAFSDVNETVPELAWPNSIATYSKMRTDAQIASLLLAFTLPIRRYGWFVDPNGARDWSGTQLDGQEGKRDAGGAGTHSRRPCLAASRANLSSLC
jgi:hypothetical protein